MILKNGKIFSPKANGEMVRTEAVAIKQGKILSVGSNEEVIAFADEQTEMVDCTGKTVLPGLCDAHCHPSIAASLHAGCNLFGVYIQENETPDEIIDQYMERLKQFIEEHPDDSLIRGTGWVKGNFTGDRIPTRHDIDKICSDRPVILESFCQHNLWVNTKALELAGVDEHTPDAYAGEIYREKDGFPSGIFSEPEAMELIKANVPGYDFSVEKYKESLLLYQREYANKYGVTLIQDCMHSENARQAYVELAREGKLTLRARGVYLLEPNLFEEQISEYIARKGQDNVGEDFRIDTIKIFAEGIFVLKEPFEETFIQESGLPENYKGESYWKDEELVKSAKAAMDAGFSVHIHAMGDESVSQAARCLKSARQQSEGDPRNVIAHLMLVDEQAVKDMKEANIIANCQPRWMVYDSDIDAMLSMLGKERSESAYPLKKFLDEDICVAFGTDFPVTPPPDTMHEIQCAMTRTVFPDAPDYEKFKGKVLGTEKAATLEEAIRALSFNGAYQMFADEYTGSIEIGKSADFVILDCDLEEKDVNEIYAINVEKTIFKGKVVYEKVV